MRGSGGEHSEAEGGTYDISNRERMGLTEFQVTVNSFLIMKDLCIVRPNGSKNYKYLFNFLENFVSFQKGSSARNAIFRF